MSVNWRLTKRRFFSSATFRAAVNSLRAMGQRLLSMQDRCEGTSVATGSGRQCDSQSVGAACAGPEDHNRRLRARNVVQSAQLSVGPPGLRPSDRPRGAGGGHPRDGAGRSPAGRAPPAGGTAPCCDGPRGSARRERPGRWRGPRPAASSANGSADGVRPLGAATARAGSLVPSRRRRATKQGTERHAKRLGGDLVGASHGHVIEEPHRGSGTDVLLVDPHPFAQSAASRSPRAVGVPNRRE